MTKKEAYEFRELILHPKFEMFKEYLSRMKDNIYNIIGNIPDDEDSFLVFKRLQGQLQMIDTILTEFDIKNVDKILEDKKTGNTF